MRKCIQPLRGVRKPRLIERTDHLVPHRVTWQGAMQRDRFRDLLADTVQRVEAGHRLLKHHAREAATRLVQRVVRGACHLLSVQPDRASGIASAPRQQL